MKHFAVTFMFDPSLAKVVLIRKNRPDWMAGKLNAPGGHVEAGETEKETAAREFTEETGLHCNPEVWKPFLRFTHPGPDGTRAVTCYWTVSVKFAQAKSMTDELVGVFDVQSLLSRDDLVKDTLWVLLMAQEAARSYPDYEVSFVAHSTNLESRCQRLV